MSAPAPPPINRFPILTRSEAGIPTRPAGSALQRVTRIIVHHTAHGYSDGAQPDVTLARANELVKKIYSGHRHGGWNDIGYHIIGDGAGRAFQGREYVRSGSFGPGRTPPGLAVGSHTFRNNPDTIGYCLLGCFGDRKDGSCGDTPSDAAVDTLVRFLVVARQAYGRVPVSMIVGHRDRRATACPGDRLYALLPQIRERVRALA